MEISDNQLKEIIRTNAMDTISDNFTSKFMQQLQLSESKCFVYEPIISKRSWYIIAASALSIVVLLVVFALTSPSVAPQSSYLIYLKGITVFISQLFAGFNFSTTTAAVLVSTALFIWISYYFDNQKKRLLI